MSEAPTVWCPKCGVLFSLPDEPPAAFSCTKCAGPISFPDLDAPTRAYLLASAVAVGSPGAAPTPPGNSPSSAALEVRDPEGTPILALQGATTAELARTRAAPEIDRKGLESLLQQIPQAVFSSVLLGEMAGHVVLQVSPGLAAQLASHTAKFMPAVTGGLRGNIIDVVTGAIIGQASFVPVSVATMGAAAAWQVLSLLVAQKHLYDINGRLHRIEGSLRDLRELMDQDLFAEIHGDALHLVGWARALSADGDTGALAARRQSVDGIVKSARIRHKQLTDRVGLVEKKFAPVNRSASELQADLDALSRGVVALRLNALLFAGSVEMLRQLGESPAYTAVLDEDLERIVLHDDEWLGTVLRRVHDSVMSLSTTFSYKVTDAKTRMGLASRVWTGAKVAARVRREVARASDPTHRDTPRLLVHLGEGQTVSSVAWLEDIGSTERVGARTA